MFVYRYSELDQFDALAVVCIYFACYNTCPAGPVMPVVHLVGSSSCLSAAHIIASLSRAVFSQFWPSSSSTQCDKSISGSHCISAWTSNTRSLVYAGGHPSGTYSRQPLPWQPCSMEDGGVFSPGWWLVLKWWCGILTPNWSVYNAIASQSDHECPHRCTIVSPSAMLPTVRGHSISSPDIIADRASVLFSTSKSDSRKMAQVGNTISTIKSHRACNGSKMLATMDMHGFPHNEGILPKRPYLRCVSMVGRALLAGYHR